MKQIIDKDNHKYEVKHLFRDIIMSLSNLEEIVHTLVNTETFVEQEKIDETRKIVNKLRGVNI